MKLKKKIFHSLFLLLCLTFLTSTPVKAEIGVSLGIKASTLGLGVEIGKSIIPNQWKVRAAFNTASASLDGEIVAQDIEYTSDITLSSWSVWGDFYPWKAGFHLTAGFVANNNTVEATITSSKEYEVGGRVYTKEDQGQLDTNFKWPQIAPYFGLGWGNPTTKGLGMVFELGAMYQNSPEIELIGTGMLAPTAPANQALFDESFEGAKVWFLVSLGFTYGF